MRRTTILILLGMAAVAKAALPVDAAPVQLEDVELLASDGDAEDQLLNLMNAVEEIAARQRTTQFALREAIHELYRNRVKLVPRGYAPPGTFKASCTPIIKKVNRLVDKRKLVTLRIIVKVHI